MIILKQLRDQRYFRNSSHFEYGSISDQDSI